MSLDINEKEFFEFKLEKLRNEIKNDYDVRAKELEAQNNELKNQIDILNSKMVEPKPIDLEDDDDNLNYVI